MGEESTMKIKCSLLGGLVAGCLFIFCSVFIGAVQRQPNSYWKGRQTINSCRLTAYQKGKRAGDKYSKEGQSTSGVELAYVTPTSVGTAAAPLSVPMWSIVKVKISGGGTLLAVVVDRGTDVNSGKAYTKSKEKDSHNKSLVIDLCSPSQSWNDFMKVDLFYYVGPLDSEGRPLNVTIKQLFNRSFVENITH